MQDGDGKAAHAAIGPRYNNVSGIRPDAGLFQRNDAQHRRVAGRADGHRVTVRHAVRSMNQPVRLDARVLGQAAPVLLAHPPAVKNDPLAGREIGVLALFNDPGEIDAGHHGKAAHDGAFAGNGQRILVVQRAVVDFDQYVALREISLRQRLHRCAIALFVLLDQDAVKHGCSVIRV
ncbi:hypothetical protein D3C71_1473830 [compost metagenome]